MGPNRYTGFVRVSESEGEEIERRFAVASETGAHRVLKGLAVEFLLGVGCRAVATEVRCPICRYRADVAGYLDKAPSRRRWEWGGSILAGERAADGCADRAGPVCGATPKTVLIECKQSRADFLRDRRDGERLLGLREEIGARRRYLEEERIKGEEPQLRRSGSSLFAELEEWDFASSRIEAYRRLLRQERRLDEQLHGETKFWLAARYRLADYLFIAAPEGMIRAKELPHGWGLLACPRALLGSEPRAPEGPGLRVIHGATERSSSEEHRLRLLRNIAVAATRASVGRARGVGAAAAL